MPHLDPRIDAYIAKSADFAKPVLNHLRKLVHRACPDVEETLKWGFPHFMHKGMLCSMAGFKQHCAFIFWKGSLISDSKGILDKQREEGMGHLGRIQSVRDLPEDKILIEYIRQAVKLNEAGVKLPPRSVAKSTKTAEKKLEIPAYFLSAVKKDKKASQTFEGFSPSHKKEYVEWIVEAKTEETRNKRLETAVQWMAEGKPRNWKYMNR